MTERPVPSKTELLEALRSSREQVVLSLRRVPVEQFEEGRYEGGWTGRQILAHIAAIEWSMPRLLDLARQGVASSEGAAAPPTATMRGGADAYNERQVARRAHLSIAELRDEFELNRAETIAAVEAADERLLMTPIRSAGGIVGPVSMVMQHVAVEHCLGHARDIVGTGQ